MDNNVSYNQPTGNPTPKVAAAGIAGAVSVLLIFVIQSVFKIEITAEVASSITVIMSFVAGYIKQDEKPAPAVEIIQRENKEI